MSHTILATALEYPQTGEVRAALHHYSAFGALSPAELEELYTRTFDINPVCSLEVGWHLWGEDYSRGTFLVGMRRLMRDLGVEEGSELPDHLCSVLRVLGRMQAEDAGRFAREYVLPAVQRMLEGLPKGDNPYRTVLEEVERFLTKEHGEAVAWAAPAQRQPYECGGCHGR